ncbi:MAG: serine/threonine protein kinase [Bacteroidales bacterium]|nr:serine/threonine protein kinase [Bacteroidales bacterium]
MPENFTSGTFGEPNADIQQFHDYREIPHNGAEYSKLYSVISGQRKLFLKAVNPEDGKTTENLSRLQREYDLFERFYGNEHIARCIAWRNDPQVGHCIVMEYIDGENLSDYLAKSPSGRERKRILNELLDAVEFIHRHQVVHNDLKPENILITHNGHNVKLIDFGYADGDFSSDKATGGTKAYASPELLERNETNGQSDIYSIGFIIRALFPHRYKLIVRKCQRKNAKRRYKTASNIGKAIKRHDFGIMLSGILVAVCVILLAMLCTKNSKPINLPLPIEEHHDTIVEINVDSTENSPQTEPQPAEPEEKHPEVFQPADEEHSVQTEPKQTQSSAINLDSIHRYYYDLYDKYERELKAGIADGSIKYMEFAEKYYQLFASDLYCLKQKMLPDDRDLSDDFEKDYMAVYGMLTSKFSVIISNLPSYDVVKDKHVRDSLNQRLDILRKQVMDKQLELRNCK